MFVVPFVLLACGQVPTVGVPDVVTSTMIVQLVNELMICRPATAMTFVPAVAVTVPPEQVPVTFEGVAMRSPAGSVS